MTGNFQVSIKKVDLLTVEHRVSLRRKRLLESLGKMQNFQKFSR